MRESGFYVGALPAWAAFSRLSPPFRRDGSPRLISPSSAKDRRLFMFPSLVFHAFFFARRRQNGVRVHTIDRSTGQARIWELGATFFCNNMCNIYDAEGGSRVSSSFSTPVFLGTRTKMVFK